MKSKIITIVTPFYYPQVNGVSHVAQKNVLALLELGYDVIVLTNKEGVAKSSETVYGFDLEGNGTLLKPVKGDKNEFINQAVFYSQDSDLIILHCWHIWSTNLILDNYSKFNSKVFVYSHGTSTRSRKFNFYFILRYINYFFESFKLKKYINLIDGLIAITDSKDHYRCLDIKNKDESKKSLLLNPIIDRSINSDEFEKARIRYQIFFKTDLKIAFCLSNYEEIKNQKYLIDLVVKHSFKLICVGSKKTNYYLKLKRYVKNNNLEDKILLEYDKDDSTIEWLFKNSSFFLFGSRNDFSPLVLIESSKYSLPFISFKTADSDRKGGFFCANEGEYESNLQLFIKNKKEDLDRIGMEGSLFYNQNNSYISYKNKLGAIIDGLM
jgi:hypothetical protein